MKRSITHLFICFLPLGAAVAQTSVADSLQRMLHEERTDTGRTMLLVQLGRIYMFSQPDTALLFAEQGLSLARSIHYAKGEANALMGAANTFLSMGNGAKALELGLQALIKAEEIGDKQLQARALNNIGAVYGSESDYVKALEYFFKGRGIAMELGDQRRLQRALNNIGDSYEKLDRLDSARVYMNQAYDLGTELKDPGAIGMALNNFGNIYSKMGQPDVAMANYRMSVPYYIEVQDDDGLCETSIGMARLFQKSGQHDSSLHYAKRAYELAQGAGFTQRVLTAATFLADSYRARNLVDSSYKYLSAVILAKDTLFGQERTKQLQSLSFDEAMRQHELANLRAAEEQKRSDNLEYAFIAVGLVTFILVFFLLSNSVIVHERWIHFLGVLGLLLVFEFINLYFHHIIAEITHHSPLLMLLALVAIASLLIPLHHRIEHWVTHRIVAKNKKLQLEAAKKALARLEAEEEKE